MKLKFKIDFKNLTLLKIFKKHYSILLWLFLLVFVVLVGFVILGEYKKLLQSKATVNDSDLKIVRVDLAKHKEIETKLNASSSFQPQAVPKAFVFGVEPTKSSAKTP